MQGRKMMSNIKAIYDVMMSRNGKIYTNKEYKNIFFIKYKLYHGDGWIGFKLKDGILAEL